MKYALGVDIGGTNTVFGIVNQNGTVLYETSVKTKEFHRAEDLVDYISHDLESNKFRKDLIGIGVGAPNGNYFTGNIEFAPNLQWKGIVPLAKLFSEKMELPTLLTNDANAAAIGEMLFGAAKNMKHFVTITLGTGLGSGVIIDGKIVYGHDGLAGEYGHIRVVENGRLCGCGRQGCLETYASSTGAVRSIKELDSENKATSVLIALENPTSLDIYNAAKDGDKFAREIIDYTARILGSALADFICFSSPQAFVLFGGFAQAGQPFSDQVKSYMELNTLTIYKNKVSIKISGLQDKNAAVLGCAATVFVDFGNIN